MSYRADQDAALARAAALERELGEARAELAQLRDASSGKQEDAELTQTRAELKAAGAELAALRRATDDKQLGRELAEARAVLKATRAELDELRAEIKVANLASLRKQAAEARKELKELRDKILEAREASAKRAPKVAAPAVAKPVEAAPARKPRSANLAAKAMFLAAQRAFELGQLAQAHRVCSELIRAGVEHTAVCPADVYLLLGRTLLAQRQPAQAQQAFAQGLALEPHHKGLRGAMSDASGKR